MRGCELIWDVDTADRMQGLIEDAAGGTCPCFSGRHCPLLPADFVLQIEAAASVKDTHAA